jgi:hypothetical protein
MMGLSLLGPVATSPEPKFKREEELYEKNIIPSKNAENQMQAKKYNLTHIS